jgi:hypothetical protein
VRRRLLALDAMLRRVDDARHAAKRAGGGGCTWADTDTGPLRQAS